MIRTETTTMPQGTQSTQGSSTTTQAVTHSSRRRAPAASAPPSLESLFYQHLRQLGEITKTHRLWKDKKVSFYLHKWIVDTLRAYIRTPLSGDALQIDIRQRLQALSALLVDALYQASVEYAVIDRRTFVWNREDLEDFKRLARAFGVGEHYLEATEEGAEGVFISPIDMQPMQLRTHRFMNAMINWLRSLPMHLIDPTIRPPQNQARETATAAEAQEGQAVEQAITLHVPVELGPLDYLRYHTLLRVANFARERIFQANREETTQNAEQAFQAAMARLIAEGQELAEQARQEQIAFEESMRSQITTLQQTFESDTQHLRNEVRELKEENAANAQRLHNQQVTINSLSTQVSQLQVANAERRVEIREVHHQARKSSSFCSLM